jgi:Sec-independent protein secretion pathway component TatC
MLLATPLLFLYGVSIGVAYFFGKAKTEPEEETTDLTTTDRDPD